MTYNWCRARTSRRQYSRTDSAVSLNVVEGCHPVAAKTLRRALVIFNDKETNENQI
jgi:hypothetical protein